MVSMMAGCLVRSRLGGLIMRDACASLHDADLEHRERKQARSNPTDLHGAQSIQPRPENKHRSTGRHVLRQLHRTTTRFQ
jgi:hypothetical protein